MGSLSISSSLKYISYCLQNLGLKHVSSQILLLAAENHPSATPSLLSCLLEMVVSHLTWGSLPKVHTSCSHSRSILPRSKKIVSFPSFDGEYDYKSYTHESTQDPICSDPLHTMSSMKTLEDKLSFVKFYLALWGYSPNSPFFALHCKTKESRQLLLALGWLIAYCGSFSHCQALDTCFCPCKRTKSRVVNSFSNTLAIEREREAAKKAQDYVSKVIVTSNNLEYTQVKAKTRAEHVLMVYGHLRMTMRTLYSLINCKAKRNLELIQTQVVHGIKNPSGQPFNLFELNLLEDRQVQEKHLMFLQMKKDMVEKEIEFDKHEKVFWQWMHNVAAIEAYHQSKSNEHTTKMSVDEEPAIYVGVCTSTLSQTFSYYQKELNCLYLDQKPLLHPKMMSKDQDNKLIAAKDDLLSYSLMTPQKKIIEEIDLCKSIIYEASESHGAGFGISGSCDEDNTNLCAKKLLDSFGEQLSRDFSCPSRYDGDDRLDSNDTMHIRWLQYISKSLASMLAKIRMQNRMSVQEALHLSIGNEVDYFIGGL